MMLIIVISTEPIVSAAEKKKTQPRQEAVQIYLSVEPVSTTATDAPRSDTDIIGFYHSINANEISKQGEFETKDEYNKRLKAFHYGNLRIDSLIFRSMNAESSPYCSAIYSADDAKLTVKCDFNAGYYIPSIGHRFIKLPYNHLSKFSKYNVIERVDTNLVLAIGNLQPTQSFRATIPVQRSDAVSAKMWATVGLILTEIPPFTTPFTDSTEHYLVTKIEEVWIYDLQTQKIYQKFTNKNDVLEIKTE